MRIELKIVKGKRNENEINREIEYSDCEYITILLNCSSIF